MGKPNKKATQNSAGGSREVKMAAPPKRNKATREGMSNGSSTGDSSIQEFYSVGTRATQPVSSDQKRNFYVTMDLIGNPFFTGTQPSNARSKYDYNRTAIDVSDYFVDNLFGAYEYYRVSKIETTFIWCHPGEGGFVNGELYTAIDKDSREPENSNAYTNRRDLKRKLFDVTQLSHSVSYTPYMVDYVNDDENERVQYVQPTDRWWNCSEFRNHRWGCLRYILINNFAPDASDASVFVKHRVWIQTKGQKDVITPSVPPAFYEYGKQLPITDDTEAAEEHGPFTC